MVDPVTAVAVGSALAGAFGKKDKGAAPEKQGFAALPKEVQDAWLKTFAPAVQEQYERPFQAVPMARVEDTGDPFQSQALIDLQRYSDDIGGFFSPTDPNGS